MYIAVSNHNLSKVDLHNLLVFDTEDCTVEQVDWLEADALGIEVVNIAPGLLDGSLLRNNLLGCLDDFDVKDGFVHFNIDDGKLYVGDRILQIEYMDGRVFSINGCKMLGRRTNLLTMFLHRAFLVCILYTVLEGGWDNKYSCYSKAVVSLDGKVELWNKDYSVCTNKALAVQIDTIYGW